MVGGGVVVVCVGVCVTLCGFVGIVVVAVVVAGCVGRVAAGSGKCKWGEARYLRDKRRKACSGNSGPGCLVSHVLEHEGDAADFGVNKYLRCSGTGGIAGCNLDVIGHFFDNLRDEGAGVCHVPELDVLGVNFLNSPGNKQQLGTGFGVSGCLVFGR